MPCSCKDIETKHGNSQCKCVFYRDSFPDCQCENDTVSDHSPGPVGSDEVLVRELYSPFYINRETGEVTPMAFKDILARGLSVTRCAITTKTEHLAKINQKIANDQSQGRNNDGFWRVVAATASDIRNLTIDGGGRAFCVYDTGTENDPSHADVCQSVDLEPKTKGRNAFRKKLRNQLFEVFVGEVTDLDNVYTG